MKMKRIVFSLLIVCIGSMMVSAKGIIMEWPTHDAADSVIEFDIQRLNLTKSGEQLCELINKTTKSKYFKNFTILFKEVSLYEEPLVEITCTEAPFVFDYKKRIAGVFSMDDQHNYFVIENSDSLWRKHFSCTDGNEHLALHKYSVPDSVYITWPDVTTTCVAKIGTDGCKILYYEIDGKIIEEDAKFEELLQFLR